MKTFATICLLAATGYAFTIKSIDALDFDSSFDDIDDFDKPKKKTAVATLIPQIPSFSEADGHDEMVSGLIEDQKACVEDVKDCKIVPDEESSKAGFGLGALLDGVAEGLFLRFSLKMKRTKFYCVRLVTQSMN